MYLSKREAKGGFTQRRRGRVMEAESEREDPMALAVLRMDHTFDGMAFSIHSYEEGTDPEVSAVQRTESQSAKHCFKSSFIYSLGDREDTLLRF